MKTSELKELLRLSKTECHLKNDAVGVLRDAAPSLAAEVIALRELLAEIVREVKGYEQRTGHKQFVGWYAKAKEHLTDTEG